MAQSAVMSALSKRLTGEPVSKVEIHISCKGLLNKDVMSKSDPCCVMYTMSNGSWYEVGASLSYKCYVHRTQSTIDLDIRWVCHLRHMIKK